MKKLEKIDIFIRKELRKEFNKTKKEIDPLFSHLRFKDITVKWWIKKAGRQSVAGICYKGYWTLSIKSKTGRNLRNSYHNLILLSKEYYESNGLQDTLNVFQHEILHLIAKDKHGTHFKALARACNATRYCAERKTK